jgi:hypothetical protein
MQSGETIFRQNRVLARDALLKRAVDCQEFFEHCLSQNPDWDWAIKGLWYSKHFRHCLGSQTINVARCVRLGETARRRFRCSHPAALAILGKDVVKWVDREYGGTGRAA